jgi:NAD-dependent dihydropyrimidine dehydrogenase PreA subunit
MRTHEKFPGVEWVDGAGDFIRVDVEKCTGCANCRNVCLGDCWEMVDRKAKIKSLKTCMECASCWYVCDAGAVTFTWPKGGTGYRSDWG